MLQDWTKNVETKLQLFFKQIQICYKNASICRSFPVLMKALLHFYTCIITLYIQAGTKSINNHFFWLQRGRNNFWHAKRHFTKKNSHIMVHVLGGDICQYVHLSAVNCDSCVYNAWLEQLKQSTGCPAKLFPLCFLLISQLPEVPQSKIRTFLICPIHVDNKNVIKFYPSCIYGWYIHENVTESLNVNQHFEP